MAKSDIARVTDQSVFHAETDAMTVQELSIAPDAVAVTFRSSASLSSLQGIERLEEIRELDLGYCPKISDLSPLAKLPKLRVLDVSRCTGVTDWSPLRDLRRLRVLIMEGMPDDRALESIGKLSGLTDLNLSCSSFISIAPLATLVKLKRLKLEACRELSDISALAAMPSLRSVDIGFCYDLLDVSPLGHIKPDYIETTTDAFPVDESERVDPDARLIIWYETWMALNKISMPASPKRIRSAENALNIIWPLVVSRKGKPKLFATPDYLYVWSKAKKAFEVLPIEDRRSESVADAISSQFETTRGPIEISIASNDFLDVLRDIPQKIKDQIRSVTVSLWPNELSRLSDTLAGSSLELEHLVLRNLGAVRVISGIYGVSIGVLSIENCPLLEEVDGYPPLSISRITVSHCPRLDSFPLIQHSLIETIVEHQEDT